MAELHSPNYFLIACGTNRSQYPDSYPPLSLVEQDIHDISQILTQQYGYKRVLQDVSLNPGKEELPDAFQEWLLQPERSPEDHIIFYYAGHGEIQAGDQHYLVVEKTNPDTLARTGLAIDELVKPLTATGVTVAQILFIIDTCHSGAASSDIASYSSQVIQHFKPIKDRSLLICSIAASHDKEEAFDGVFSKAFIAALQESHQQPYRGYLALDQLVDTINQSIQKTYPNLRQSVQHTMTAGQESARFFKHLPSGIQSWETIRSEKVDQLLEILDDIQPHLFWYNAYLLVIQTHPRLILEREQLRTELERLSQQPLTREGIYEFYDFSEWCVEMIWDQDDPSQYSIQREQLEQWQKEVCEARPQIVLSHVRTRICESMDTLTTMLSNRENRLLITLTPYRNPNKNQGEATGDLVMNADFYLDQQTLPMFRVRSNERLPLQKYRLQGHSDPESLYECLKETNCFLPMICDVQSLLLGSFVPESRLMVELFLPQQYFETAWDCLLFDNAGCPFPLGANFRLTINSHSRYFDKGYQFIRRDAIRKKKKLWPSANRESEPKYCDSPPLDPRDPDQLQDYDIYTGNVPSAEMIQRIERQCLIAVWGRESSSPLDAGKDLNLSEWKIWPQKVCDYRRRNRGRPVTLFWDDSFPKPKPFAQKLSTSVVE